MKKWLCVLMLILLTACGTKSPEDRAYQSLCQVGDTCYGVDLSGNIYEVSWDGDATLLTKTPTTQWLTDEDMTYLYYQRDNTIYSRNIATGTKEKLCSIEDIQQLEAVAEGYLLYWQGETAGKWQLQALDLTTLESWPFLEAEEPVELLCSANGVLYMSVMQDERGSVYAWNVAEGAVTLLTTTELYSEAPVSGVLVEDGLYYVAKDDALYSIPVTGAGERECHSITGLGTSAGRTLTRCGEELYITQFYEGTTTIYRYDPETDHGTKVGAFTGGVVRSFVSNGSRYGVTRWDGANFHTTWGDLNE